MKIYKIIEDGIEYEVSSCGNHEQYWRVDGQFHRAHGPAVILPSRTQMWYLHGQLHREDGPAIIALNGYQQWCYHSKCHRLDGPAIITPEGIPQWWFKGEQLEITSEQQFVQWLKLLPFK